MPLSVIVVVSNVLHVMYTCNLNRVRIFTQYYVNRVSAVSSPNSVILVFVL